jgi:hypothetical protein
MYSLTTKGGQSANKFCKLQIRKLPDLPNLFELTIFGKCGKLRICVLRTHLFAICGTKFFADLKSLQIHKNIIFLFIQMKAYNALIQKCARKILPNNPAAEF